MPRRTVHIKDDLAARIKESGEENFSALVDRSLRRELGDERVATYERPPDARRRVREAARKLASDAQAEYTAGYEAALRRLPELSWEILDPWAENNFERVHNPRSWLEDLERREADRASGYLSPEFDDYSFPSWETGMANDLARYDTEIERYVPLSRTFLRGYADALRDAHEAVTGGEVTDSDNERTGEAPETA